MKFAIIRRKADKAIMCYEYFVEEDQSFSGAGILERTISFQSLTQCLAGRDYNIVIFESEYAARSYADFTLGSSRKEVEVVLLSELE